MSLDLWRGKHCKGKNSPSSKALVFRSSLCSPLCGKVCIFIFVSFQQHNYVSIFFILIIFFTFIRPLLAPSIQLLLRLPNLLKHLLHIDKPFDPTITGIKDKTKIQFGEYGLDKQGIQQWIKFKWLDCFNNAWCNLKHEMD
jgi:hypothetical protein